MDGSNIEEETKWFIIVAGKKFQMPNATILRVIREFGYTPFTPFRTMAPVPPFRGFTHIKKEMSNACLEDRVLMIAEGRVLVEGSLVVGTRKPSIMDMFIGWPGSALLWEIVIQPIAIVVSLLSMVFALVYGDVATAFDVVFGDMTPFGH